jgi:hypothetical protein
LAKKIGVFFSKLSKIMQKIDHNIDFLNKNANFFAENCQKSQKIVIITSTPGHPADNVLKCAWTRSNPWRLLMILFSPGEVVSSL